MSLGVGARLGHYAVTAKLGEGGMGEVWRATDTQLNRDVALKILPEAFATDPDRLARFQREAQVLASLNHPGIAAIYGIEEQDGTRALVLELVEGPTLADRISKGPIPLDEALPIAKQIAEALEAAHEAGVIHRDLKPANIKVREDGTVKVLDFGLAKALDQSPTGDPSQSPTLTAAATQMGVIMGTPAYMSPEQASGTPVDKRADIWSFGVVLFEMLTGQRMFTGETVSHVLASVLRADPDWTTLPTETPAAINRLLRRCLAKDRRVRTPDVAVARIEIDDAITAPVIVVNHGTSVHQPQVWQRPVPLIMGVVVLLVAAVFFGQRLRPRHGPVVSCRSLRSSRISRSSLHRYANVLAKIDLHLPPQQQREREPIYSMHTVSPPGERRRARQRWGHRVQDPHPVAGADSFAPGNLPKEHLRKSLWGTFLWGAAGATFRLGARPWSQAEERVNSTNPTAEPVDVRGIDVTRRPPPGDSRPAAVLLDASRVSASRRWRVCLVDPPTLGAPPHLLHVCATAVTEARSLLSFVRHFHITNRALWCR